MIHFQQKKLFVAQCVCWSATQSSNKEVELFQASFSSMFSHCYRASYLCAASTKAFSSHNKRTSTKFSFSCLSASCQRIKNFLSFFAHTKNNNNFINFFCSQCNTYMFLTDIKSFWLKRPSFSVVRSSCKSLFLVARFLVANCRSQFSEIARITYIFLRCRKITITSLLSCARQSLASKARL